MFGKVHDDGLVRTFDRLEQWDVLVERGSKAEQGGDEAVDVDTGQHCRHSVLS